MRITVSDGNAAISAKTQVLLRKMLSPICGLDQKIGFLLRSQRDARMVTAGADLTGVHLLNGRHKQGSYHIGACGVLMEEVVIRTLGETIERYAQCVSAASGRHPIVMAPYSDMVARGERVISEKKLGFFSPQQYARPGFPFKPFDANAPIGWVKARSLVDEAEIWVPAQLALVGYIPKCDQGESWLLTGVTTGSAAHTKLDLAVRNSILELIQIDSAMGHWFSGAQAPEILMDKRTEALATLIQKYGSPKCSPKFYWLQNADLASMAVACVIREEPGRVPAVAVGLGADLRLVQAMYKAFLEAAGVAQLATINLLQDSLHQNSENGKKVDPTKIYDLDSNVSFYAIPENCGRLNRQFGGSSSPIRASDLPEDSTLSACEEIRLMVDRFRDTHKDLLFLDLTTDDIRELGFLAVRVWSPDTISLSLPSTPPVCHPRYTSYGGANHEDPHPYP